MIRLFVFSFLFLLLGSGTFACFRRSPARIKTSRKSSASQDKWFPWSDWTECSVRCGTGRIIRHRSCRPGRVCSSPKETEMKACVNYNCDDDSPSWTSWSTCSSSCGSGWTTRSRPCTSPCPEFLQEKKPCSLTPCPIDGGLSEWGAWSSCSVTCGVGEETRFRTCTNPPPQFGGADCREALVLKRTCSLVPCHPKVHGQWSSWNAWGSCSKTCEEGVKVRSRKCDQPAPAFGGDPCAGKADETQPCVVAVYCKPPVHGEWSSWKAWTECSEQCSTGTQTRLRFCSKPQYGGRQCEGMAFQTRPCNDLCAVDGNWGKWKPATPCQATSGSCGLGWRHLERACDNPAPQHGGKPCSGDKVKAVRCWDFRQCPGPGDLQPIADFMTRSFENKTVLVSWRQVPYGLAPTNFEISFKSDSGSATKTIMVTSSTGEEDVPVDGPRFSRLIDLSTFSGSVSLWVTSLYISDPNKVQRRPSETHTFVVGEVDGSWSAWDHWSECAVTCGSGLRTRVRRCDSPTRTPNGRPCPGESQERAVCDRGFC